MPDDATTDDAPAADAETAATDAAPAANPAETLDATAAALLDQFRAELGDAVVEDGACFGDAVVRVRPDAWRRAAEVCRGKLGCDYLSFVSGIDWMPAPTTVDEGSGDTSTPAQPRETTYGVAGSAGRFQVFAVVESTRGAHGRLMLKTDVDEQDLRAESWVPVYPGADWHERETWEMYGIEFDGHPALRHLYLPFEFEGHPLRKDYPLLARDVKPWPGLVDVEPMPGEDGDGDEATPAVEAS
jgi:NADH-quinone oxidoreductase subunit C